MALSLLERVKNKALEAISGVGNFIAEDFNRNPAVQIFNTLRQGIPQVQQRLPQIQQQVQRQIPTTFQGITDFVGQQIQDAGPTNPIIAPFTTQGQKNIAEGGKLLQKFPDTTARLPDWFYGTDPNGFKSKMDRFLLETATGLPGQIVQQTGYAAEKGFTPEGREEIRQGITKYPEQTGKLFTPGKRMEGLSELFDNPATLTAFGALNVVPGGGVVPSLSKTGGRNLLLQVVKNAEKNPKALEEAAVVIRNNPNLLKEAEIIINDGRNAIKSVDELLTTGSKNLEKIINDLRAAPKAATVIEEVAPRVDEVAPTVREIAAATRGTVPELSAELKALISGVKTTLLPDGSLSLKAIRDLVDSGALARVGSADDATRILRMVDDKIAQVTKDIAKLTPSETFKATGIKSPTLKTTLADAKTTLAFAKETKVKLTSFLKQAKTTVTKDVAQAGKVPIAEVPKTQQAVRPRTVGPLIPEGAVVSQDGTFYTYKGKMTAIPRPAPIPAPAAPQVTKPVVVATRPVVEAAPPVIKPGSRKTADVIAAGKKKVAPKVAPKAAPKVAPVIAKEAPVAPKSAPEVPSAPKKTAEVIEESKAKKSSDNVNSMVKKVEEKADKLYTDSLDRLHPISKLGKQAGKDQEMRNAITGYYGTGSIAKYHTDIELSPILKSVDSTDLEKYATAQRDLELAGRGKGGSNVGDPTKVLAELKTKYKGDLSKLEEAATKLYKYQKDLVQKYLVDTGILSKEHAASMWAKNQRYVPFRRLMEGIDEIMTGVPQVKGVGSVGSQNVVKRYSGKSELVVEGPLQNIIENTYKIVGLAKRNEVAKQIVKLKDDLPEGVIHEIRTPVRPIANVTHKGQVFPEVMAAITKVVEKYGGTVERVLKKRGMREEGSFSPATKVIKTKFGTPTPTFWHEFGHLLDNKFGLRSSAFFDKATSQELRNISDLRLSVNPKNRKFTSASYKAYTRMDSEKLAEFFAMYFGDRQNALNVAPITTKKFTQFMRNKPELQELVQASKSRRIGPEYATETIWGPSGFAPREPHIEVMVDGKRKFYSVPKEVALSAGGLNEKSAGVLVRIASAPTKVFRITATGANPEFALPNLARDLGSAWVNIGLNPLAFGKGLAHYLKKDAVYEEFLKSGGMTSYISLDNPVLKREVADLSGFKNRGIKTFSPKKVWDIIKEVSQASEQPTRIAAFEKVYNKTLKQGFSVAEAQARGAYAGQEATVNFARRGAATREVNMLYAFLNARAQGVDRLVRSLKADPKGAGLRLASIAVVPGVGLYAHNRNFESYFDERIVPAYEKRTNFIIMLSETPIDSLGGAQYIKIPKGDVGKLANPVEAFLQHLDGKGEANVGSLLAETLKAFSPLDNIGDAIPTSLRPAIENAANYNFFTKLPIISESKKDYPAQAQVNKNTSALYRAIGAGLKQVSGGKVDISPLQIQNLLRGYLTGYARLAELGSNPLASEDTYSGQDINQTPIARRFFGGAVRSEEEGALNEFLKQKGIMNKIQDIKTGVKYGNIPADEGMNKINELLGEAARVPVKTEPAIGPKKAGAAGPGEEKGTSTTFGDIIFTKGGETIDLTPPTKGEGIDAFTNKDWKYTKAREVFKADLTKEEKSAAYKKLGVTGDVEYDYKASKTVDIKTDFLVSKNLDHDALIAKLVDTRKPSISGLIYSSDGVVDNMVDLGLITKAEGTALKKIDFNKDGTPKVSSGGGAGGLSASKVSAYIKKVNTLNNDTIGKIAGGTGTAAKPKKITFPKLPASPKLDFSIKRRGRSTNQWFTA